MINNKSSIISEWTFENFLMSRNICFLFLKEDEFTLCICKHSQFFSSTITNIPKDHISLVFSHTFTKFYFNFSLMYDFLLSSFIFCTFCKIEKDWMKLNEKNISKNPKKFTIWHYILNQWHSNINFSLKYEIFSCGQIYHDEILNQ